MRVHEQPDPLELFMQYHLGLLPDGSARFQNANQIAARYGVGVEQLNAWLKAAQLDAQTADDTDYDLPKQHGEAQVLAMLGDTVKTLTFAAQSYADYRARRGSRW